MPRHHVGEQPEAEGHRAGEVGNDLDGHQQRRHVEGHAGGHEEAEEAEPVLDQGDQGDAKEHHQGEGEGDDDVARHREGVRNEPDHVGEQDEHEQREDEGEVLAPLGADVLAHQLGDELVTELGQGLPAARHQGALAHAKRQEQGDRGDGDDHEDGCVGEGRVEAADGDVHQGLDFELL